MKTSSLTDSADTAGRRIKGWHVLAGLVVFFVSIMAVNFYMAYAAISTYSGLDTPDAYRKGLAYNQRIAAEAKQTMLGWSDTMAWTGSTPTLSVRLSDRDGSAITGLHVTAKVGRPATNRFDRVLVLAERAPGRYEASIADAETGTWAIEMTAARTTRAGSETVYEARRRLWLKR